VARTVTTQRVEVVARGRRFRITLTPLADYYSCTVEEWQPDHECWLYLGPAHWEHTTGTYTYPDDDNRKRALW
jgi:hypothetical protein